MEAIAFSKPNQTNLGEKKKKNNNNNKITSPNIIVLCQSFFPTYN